MGLLRRRTHRLSVVVPAYGVQDYLPTALDSVLAQPGPPRGVELEVVVVDDGSTDDSGAIADEYAARDDRVRVVHTDNHGLGAARNEGVRHATGDLLAFLDGDDALPADAYGAMLKQLRRTGADFVTGSIVRWFDDGSGRVDGGTEEQPPWMRRLHRERRVCFIEQHPEILGDVFAWNKLWSRAFYDGAALSWPEGVRYEDQPTTTEAYLRARRIGIVPDVVYRWRVRHDGSSITQQRATVEDLRDRWTTKRMTLDSVHAYGSTPVTRMAVDKVLAGDLPRYFAAIPDADDEWWELLVSGVREIWAERPLTGAGLPPAQRLVGWLVQHDRREEAELVTRHLAALPPGERVARVEDRQGRRIDVPGLDPRSVARVALALRDDER